METLNSPLTNLQLELLKLFARDVPEADLLEIRKMLAQYFAEKAMDGADQVWEEKGLKKADATKLSKSF